MKLARVGVFLFFFSTLSSADIALPSIVIDGGSADALLYDPILPTYGKTVARPSGSGSITTQIAEETAVPLTDYGVPGAATQLRFLGGSAVDTNVQALGVPLNAPQGGGFNYSSFPQFFWSRYQFQLGPSAGAYDSKASTGTVSLTPWTDEALRSAADQFRVTQSVTDAVDLSQTSVAAKSGPIAALAGYSAGNAQGPTGGISVLLLQTPRVQTKAHLLITSLNSISPSAQSFPTPGARFKETRMIPVLQNDISFAPETILKTSLFYDQDAIHYDVPTGVFAEDSYSRSSQVGIENAMIAGDWTAGVSARQVGFSQVGFVSPSENVFHLVLERAFRPADAWTATATLEANSVSQEGLRPGGGLGLRLDVTPQLGLFARADYVQSFPTLIDRYFSGDGFTGNPGVRPEKTLTSVVGAEYKARQWESSLQMAAVLKHDAQFNGTLPNGNLSPSNQGTSREISLLHQLKVSPAPWFGISNFMRLTNSWIEMSSEPIPYDPVWTETIRAEVHEKSESPVWLAGLSGRFLSSAFYSANVAQSLGGYYYLSVDAQSRLLLQGKHEILLMGKIENLLDRPIQIVQGYPWSGRQITLAVMGTL